MKIKKVKRKTVCRLCGKGINEIGGFLQRVNSTGKPGIWECRPACGAHLHPDDRVMNAITGGVEHER